MVQHVKTDVLIIGGGGAGARAALEAHTLGLDVLLVVKGLLGKSGCSIFAGSLDYFASEGEEHHDEAVQKTMEFLGKYTHYLGDQEYLLQSTLYHHEKWFQWLEEIGLYLLRDDSGEVVTDIPHKTQVWAPKMGMSGASLMNTLRKMILSQQIPLLEETSVTTLLTRDGQVVGAVALDYLHGEIYVIKARAVVLATGHSNYLSKRSTGTREGAANGWVLAYQAGAALQDIEMQWYHVSDVRKPDAWMRLHLYPNPLPGTEKRAQLINRDGEMFFDGNMYPTNPVPYITQLKHLMREVQAGHADFGGGYYTSYRHVEPEVLNRWLHQTQFIRKLGLDPLRDVIENGLTWHMNVGGVRTDGETMQTDIPGLYAAGSVAALITGGLPNVVYDGLTAAHHIEQNVHALPQLDPNPEQVEREVKRLQELFTVQPDDGVLPAQVKKQIREVMWEYMGYIKTERSMQQGLAALERIREETFPKMRLGTTSHRFNMDWIEAVDARDMLDACQLIIQFSLHRKESRGGFYRADYPLTDNVDWLKHIVGRRDARGLALAEEPVKLPYVRPQIERLDFFEVDY